MCNDGKIETEEHKGVTINYYQDQTAPNPRREWDNLGIFAIKNRDWGLGSEGPINPARYDSIEEFRQAIIEEENPAVILPVYYGDNGSNPSILRVQDYRVNGYIYVTRAAALKEYSVRRITPKIKETIEAVLKGEIETFEQYINGEVYGYSIDGPEIKDSCWGYYGLKYAKEEARAVVDRHLQHKTESAWMSLSAAPVFAE